jgi:hypothetical protein
LSPGTRASPPLCPCRGFSLSEGGNAWGIYRLSRDEDLWVFFAASGGQLSVMGDVTGTRAFIESAAQNFLRFNDADAPGLRCAATAEDGRDATTLTDRLSGAQLRRCRLRKRLAPMSLILPAVVLTLATAAGVYWHDTVQQQADRDKAMEAFAPVWRRKTINQPSGPCTAPVGLTASGVSAAQQLLADAGAGLCLGGRLALYRR